MRLRNVKNKEQILSESTMVILEPMSYKGKWHELFSNFNPIYLEVGMGKGQFIINQALSHPEINFIGIEKMDSVLVRAVQKVCIDIPNLKFVRMDARFINEIFFKEIDRVFLNFSDPWPKSRHSNRRLTSPVFLEKYSSIFKEEMIIEMRTDNQDLFEYSLVSLSQYGYGFEVVSLDLHHSSFDFHITTEYEDRFVKMNNRIYYFIAHRNLKKS